MKTVFRFIMCIAFCLVIILSGIRFCLTHFFIDLEYKAPGFPHDVFGFTNEERKTYAYASVDYLLGKISDEEYQHLSFSNGEPLFNQRELSHMRDVRDLTLIALNVWYACLLIMVAGILLALRLKWQTELLRAGKSASLVIFLLIITILLGVALSFDELFTAFHSIFFEGDTWLFYTDDSLIRLFPIPFWVNVFVTVGIISLTFSFLLYFSCGSKLKQVKKEVNPKA